MRKTKRFTPQVLARFERQGRGEGIYENFTAWHQVTRGDPSSYGRSHILNWRGRLRDFLSDGELDAQLFATMLPNLDDSLEQYKLPIDDQGHPLLVYGEGNPLNLFPGTQEIAKKLGIKHPRLSDKEKTVSWTATTDLLLVFKTDQRRHMLAIAFKPTDWNRSKRTVQLLRLEREFWIQRNVPWLLITRQQFDESVYKTLRSTACWALAEPVPPEWRRLACRIATNYTNSSVTEVLEAIRSYVNTMEHAQRSLWQAIWKGELPVDLRRSWRPYIPLKHISSEAFNALNPIASRRTAWI